MDVYEAFKKLGISYNEVKHEPVETVEAAQFVKTLIDGSACKNLFLTDGKGAYIIAVLGEDKKADLKSIARQVGTSRLSFAGEEELLKTLELKRGSVTPLAVINDASHSVKVVIDKELSGKRLLMHPNVNTKTVSIDHDDLIKYIRYFKNPLYFI